MYHSAGQVRSKRLLPGEQSSGAPGTALHCPVWGTQLSSPLQRSASVQVTGEPVQTPALQTSIWVQVLPSSQACVLPSGVCTQPCVGLQVSVVQMLPSSQLSVLLVHAW